MGRLASLRSPSPAATPRADARACGPHMEREPPGTIHLRAPRAPNSISEVPMSPSCPDCARGLIPEALWVLLPGSGLRRGEALGLRWSDVDLAQGKITVRQSLVQSGRRWRASSDHEVDTASRIADWRPGSRSRWVSVSLRGRHPPSRGRWRTDRNPHGFRSDRYSTQPSAWRSVPPRESPRR